MTSVRVPSVPPLVVMLAAVKSVGASLKLKVTSAVLAARLTSLWSIVTAAVGVTVSTVKLVLAAVPGLPLSSCQLLSTLTAALLMSVPDAAVKVAV